MSFSKVCIVGLGVIGGSLAYMIREQYPSVELWGLSDHKETIDLALSKKLIDHGRIEASCIDTQMDLVIVATPLQLIPGIVSNLSEHIQSPCVFTDVGSIKGEIQAQIPSLRSRHCFIGGHPMAGRTESGLKYADANLLLGAKYFLMHHDDPRREALKDFITGLSFTCIDTDPESHDRWVAMASHLPYLMACTTTTAAESCIPKDQFDMFKQSIASGFKDTTRVAQSNPQWGVDICRGNTAAIREGLVAAKQDIERLLALLDEGESSELFAQFRRAQSIQESLRSEDL